jgi:hypothetical protein
MFRELQGKNMWPAKSTEDFFFFARSMQVPYDRFYFRKPRKIIGTDFVMKFRFNMFFKIYYKSNEYLYKGLSFFYFWTFV